MQLFEGKIEPGDVAQGALGDCWLLAAIAACVEDHPEVIKKLFITQHVEPCGCYRIRLYDTRKERWVTMIIDDRIPMAEDGVNPRFTKPHNKELWVMLLEKVSPASTPSRRVHLG